MPLQGSGPRFESGHAHQDKHTNSQVRAHIGAPWLAPSDTALNRPVHLRSARAVHGA